MVVKLIMVLSMVTFVKCEELDEFLTSINSFLDNLQKHYQICYINRMECDVRKLEQYIEMFAALSSLLLTVRKISGLVGQIVIGFPNSPRQCKYDVSRIQICEKGKRYSHLYVKSKEQREIQIYCHKEQICVLRETVMTWSNISKCLCISSKTLCRRGYEYTIPNTFSDISDFELNSVLLDMLALTPNAGETYVTGSLRASGITVQRRRM